MKKLLLSLFGLLILGLINFSSADFDITTLNQTFTVQNTGYLIPYDMQFIQNCIVNVISTGNNFNNFNTMYSFNQFSYTDDLKILSPGDYYIYEYTYNSNNCITNKFKFVELGQNNGNNENTCNPSGSCTVNNKVNENILFSGSKSFSSAGYTNMFNYGNEGAGTYCVNFSSTSPQQLTMGFANGGTTAPSNLYTLYADQYGNTICLYGNKQYFNVKLNSSSNTINYEVYKLTDLLSDSIPCEESSSSCDYTDYILLSDVTQNYCTNRYSNLIPESDITQGYCETEFDLISPEDCPFSGTGDFSGSVMWSSFWVNDRQIFGGENIYLYLPDFLSWDYTYIDQNLQIDVENTGDPDYIEDILTVQTYHPSSEDFTLSFTGTLTLLVPYIVICLFIVFLWKLIKRIFK